MTHCPANYHCSMPSIRLISENREFKNLFKEKLSGQYNISLTKNIKDGLKNLKRGDIDFLIIDIPPVQWQSPAKIEPFLRQVNSIKEEKLMTILLIDITSIDKSVSSFVLNPKKKHHIFWFDSQSFLSNKNVFMAFQFFMEHKFTELMSLQINRINAFQLEILNYPGKSLKNLLNEKSYPMEKVGNLSFIPPHNTNSDFLEGLNNACFHWPFTLLSGPEGIEKISIAEYIHNQNNANHPFITIDLATIPENFQYEMLFGLPQKNLPDFHYINNSLFENAKKGTVYIKNIQQLKWEVQSDFLNALQKRHFYRENLKIPIKCRFIFSTSVNLPKSIEKGIFRQDLHSHIGGCVLEIPTIQQRKKDIPLLIEHYRIWFSAQYKKEITITPEAKLEISKKNFPEQFDQFYGYLFQLFCLAENEVNTGLIAQMEDSLNEKKQPKRDKSPAVKNQKPKKSREEFVRENPDPTLFLFSDLQKPMEVEYSLTDLEREYIHYVLKQNFNNIAETARILGITRKTLYEKVKKYGLKISVKNTG